MVIEAKEDERVTKVTLNGPIKIRKVNFQFSLVALKICVGYRPNIKMKLFCMK
jgi:hypothetical protein